MSDGRAYGHPLLLAPGQGRGMVLGPIEKPDASKQATEPRSGSRPARSRGARAGARPSAGTSGRARATGRSAGRAAPGSARERRRRRPSRCRVTSVPSTRAVPADRGSSPDSTRISVDFPDPLGPKTTTISPSSTSSVRPCSATVAAVAGVVDAEGVVDPDSRAHSRLHDGRAGVSPGKASRVASSTTTATTTTSAPRPEGSEQPGRVEPQRRLGCAGRRRDAHERDDEPRQDDPENGAAQRSQRDQHDRAQPELHPQHRRRDALRFEVEQLAPLVVQLVDEGEPEPDRREQQRDDGRDADRERRPAGERIAGERALDVTPRREVERRERRLAQLALDPREAAPPGTDSHNSSGVPVPGRLASRAVARRLSSAIDEPFVGLLRVGEARRHPDDLRRHLRLRKRQRQRAARPGSLARPRD